MLWLLGGIQGIAFAIQPLPSGQTNLLLIPLFTNAEAGRKIFEQWKERFKEDINSKLRVFTLRSLSSLIHYSTLPDFDAVV
jgi:hypothetical protein